MHLPKIGVLVSGASRGTNFQAILDAIAKGDLRAEASLLAATNPAHGALARARDAGIREFVLAPDACSPEEWEHRVCDELYQAGVSVVVLAGYLRRISPVLLEAFPGRIL